MIEKCAFRGQALRATGIFALRANAARIPAPNTSATGDRHHTGGGVSVSGAAAEEAEAVVVGVGVAEALAFDGPGDAVDAFGGSVGEVAVEAGEQFGFHAQGVLARRRYTASVRFSRARARSSPGNAYATRTDPSNSSASPDYSSGWWVGGVRVRGDALLTEVCLS